jgi:hypothetical protein
MRLIITNAVIINIMMSPINSPLLNKRWVIFLQLYFDNNYAFLPT